MQQIQEQTKKLIFQDVFPEINKINITEKQKANAQAIWEHEVLAGAEAPKRKVVFYIKECLFARAFPNFGLLNINDAQRDMARSLWHNAQKGEDPKAIVSNYINCCLGVRKITKETINQNVVLDQLPTNEIEALPMVEIAKKANLGTYVCAEILRFLASNGRINKVKSSPRPTGGYYPSRFWKPDSVQREDLLAKRKNEVLDYIKKHSPTKTEMLLHYRTILSSKLLRAISRNLHSNGEIGERWEPNKGGYVWVFGMPDLSLEQWYEQTICSVIRNNGPVTEISLSNYIGKNRTVTGKLLRKMYAENKLTIKEHGRKKFYGLIT